MISFSDNESIEVLCLSILITDHAVIVSLSDRAAFNLKQCAQIFEQLCLHCVVFTVVLDVPLMIFQIFHYVFLLSQFGIKEFRIALEFRGQTFVRCVQKLCLISDSLEEGVIDFILDVIGVIAGLFSLVVIEELLNFFFQFVFFLIEILYNCIILLLLLIVDSF